MRNTQSTRCVKSSSATPRDSTDSGELLQLLKIEYEFSVHAKRLAGSAKIMKKTSARKKKLGNGETLRSEYRFDYSKSQPNRFAAKVSKGTVAVVLGPSVAKIFRSPEGVSAL